MKIAIVGKSRDEVETARRIVRDSGCRLVIEKPDLVISVGGDGSFLYGEHKFPGVPKLPTRGNSLCSKCSTDNLGKFIRKLAAGNYHLDTFHKIEAEIFSKGTKIKKIAANDIFIRNKEPNQSIRFTVSINNRKLEGVYNGAFIGDGIVCATPFGSTGYFYSVSKKKFKSGIGVAFNNVTQKIQPIVEEKPKIVFRLVRHTAYVCNDNDPGLVEISPGDEVVLRKSRQVFRVVR